MKTKAKVPMLLSALCVLGASLAASARAQDQPLTAGEGGVAVPKRTKTVRPEYPPEAQASGVRGIVILQLVVDTQGKVASVEVLRSVPGLDEAAMAAARQWEYEVTKVDGKPVSVRVTVPITFAMALPQVARAPGIPELRQGVSPLYPREGHGNTTVEAEVTLEPGGQVAEARIQKGEQPFANVLLQALRTWRFATDNANEILSFHLEADFVEGKGDAKPRVDVRLTRPRRSEYLAEAAPAASAPPAAPPPPQSAPKETEPSPSPTPSSPPSGAPGPPSMPTPGTTPAPAEPKAPPAPPPVEVISVPPRPAPATPEQSGVSAIKDVTLADGVPDLTRGRRPVPPPLARMGGLAGTVEVAFSVDAAGVTRLKSATGPDVLKLAAEDMVASWVFRRSTADRLHLLAVIAYSGETAAATVTVQPEEPAPQPSPAPAKK